MRICPAVVLLCLTAAGLPVHAQELNARDLVDSDFEQADVIVVGTFRVVSFYPWFDGWHYSGELQVDDVLLGDRRGKEPIPFHWLETYGTSCFICGRLSMFDGDSGIWLLTRKNGAFQFAGTAASWCGGPLPLDARKIVARAVNRRTAKK
jgi:hypothetical protein